MADKEVNYTAQWAELRKPFPKESISKMPRGGIMLDYVGHAAITDRLNSAVGPENWDLWPLSYNEDGTPVVTTRKDMAVMWCKLTILGATKLCVGTAQVSKFEVEKELIGDALRNGAMRFGLALDLWSKSELESQIEPKQPVYNRDDFQPEPSVDISESEGITQDVVTKLEGALKLKGITKKTEVAIVLTELAKTKGGETILDISLAQGREIYAQIRDTPAEQLAMLMENVK